jgi:ribosomal protein S18 acetylase RimI-like enzyme
MTENTKQGIYAQQSLTELEIAAIRALADICTSYEKLDLRLGWSELRVPSGDAPERLLYYQDNTLVGFLSLASVGGVEAEAVGMVHPRYRRQGIFTALVQRAREICREHHSLALLLTCDHSSASAQAFFTSVGAEFAFAEHKMRLDTWAGGSSFDTLLDFQAATLADADTIAQIMVDDSGMDAPSFRQLVARNIQDGSRRYYIARSGGTSVGTINIDMIDDLPYIYGFVVAPDQRGRGFGRQMLSRLLDQIASEQPGPVFLEVETENQVALGLYTSLGFVVTHTYDYNRVEV